MFAKALKCIRKIFENEQILEAIRAAELDKNQFWRLLRNTRQGASCKVRAIKSQGGKVVHDVGEVLKV